MEPLLRPADVLRALVLPAVRSSAASFGRGVRAPGTDSIGMDARRNDGAGDLRLALQLGMDSFSAAGGDTAKASQRSSSVTSPAPQPSRSDSSAVACKLVANDTAAGLIQAVCALLDARPTAPPVPRAATAEVSSAAARSDLHTRQLLLRLVELSLELMQKLTAALADCALAIGTGPRPGASPDPAVVDSEPASEGVTFRRQLQEMLSIARDCKWRTALQLAPLEAAMSTLSGSVQPPVMAADQGDSPDSSSSLSALLSPPCLRGSTSTGQASGQSGHFGNSRQLASDSGKAQQVVTECLVLSVASTDGAMAFAAAISRAAGRQNPAVTEEWIPTGISHGGLSTIQRQATALAALMSQLPRLSTRRALLAACLELLPWCTAAEYRQLTETVLPAWLAALQPRESPAAASLPGLRRQLSTRDDGIAAQPVAPGMAAVPPPTEAGSSAARVPVAAGVLQLCARVASLLVREDAAVADDGNSRCAALQRIVDVSLNRAIAPGGGLALLGGTDHVAIYRST